MINRGQNTDICRQKSVWEDYVRSTLTHGEQIRENCSEKRVTSHFINLRQSRKKIEKCAFDIKSALFKSNAYFLFSDVTFIYYIKISDEASGFWHPSFLTLNVTIVS